MYEGVRIVWVETHTCQVRLELGTHEHSNTRLLARLIPDKYNEGILYGIPYTVTLSLWYPLHNNSLGAIVVGGSEHVTCSCDLRLMRLEAATSKRRLR